jgi:hypothetical protein
VTFDNAVGIALIGVLEWVISSEIHPAIGCLALGGGFVLGGVRRSFWTGLLLAIGATTLNLVVSHFRWMSSHIREGLICEPLTVAGLLLALFGIICGAGWFLGRYATGLVRSQIST